MTRARSTLYRSARRAAAALALVAATACGGGDGGGGGGGPTTPQPGVAFSGASVTAPAVRLLRGPGSAGTTFEVQVQAESLPAVYGFAFDLSFPANLLRFDGVTEGGFLAQGGIQTSLQVAENPAGRLVVGYARLGNVGAVAGDGTLMVLRFTAVAPGGGSFTFSANQLFDAAGAEVVGPTWAGGTVQVTL